MNLPEAFLARPLAHRGLHGPGVPENSRAACAAAVAGGYGIELDLQLSADGVAMVFHDDTLDRMTAAAGPVRDRTAAELGAVALTGGSEGVPTLAEVLACVAGRAALLIEVKDQDGALGPSVGALEEAAVRALHGYEGPVAVMSFNPHSVAAMARLAPQIPRGLTTCAFTADDWPDVPPDRRTELAAIGDYARIGASFISHQWGDLHSPAVAACQAQGADVLCWTVRSAAEEAMARRIAQNITFEGYAAT